MNQFLNNQSLQEFIEMVELPQEKQKEYLTVLPKLNEDGRILLFDTLTQYYIVDSEQKKTEKALELFRNFADDTDYAKLTENLKELDNTL